MTCPRCGLPLVPESQTIQAYYPQGHWPEPVNLAERQRLEEETQRAEALITPYQESA